MRVLKSTIERALARAVAPIALRRMSGRALILAYHNVVPNDSVGRGDSPLHIGETRFGEHLDLMGEVADIVPLVELLEGPSGRRPRIAITLDDGYVGALRLGWPLLEQRGLPWTLFVAPGLLGEVLPWWDALAVDGRLPPQVRSYVLESLAGDQGAALAWSRSVGLSQNHLPEEFRIASEAELTAAAASPGTRLQLAPHSLTHRVLSRLSPTEIRHELIQGRERLERFASHVGRWIAYPYGLFNGDTARLALEAGYLAGFAVSGGWMPRHVVHPGSLPRMSVSAAVSANGLRLRLAGLLQGS